MRNDLARLQSLTSGDNRGYTREVQHGLTGLERMISKT
jgi:hypothetical protein